MREIKFRAWDGRKIIQSYAHIGSGGRMYTSHTQNPEPDYIVMQYTGLKDRHGVEIYEGDIIKYITQYYGNKVEHQKVVEWIDDMQDDSFGESLSMGYRFHGGDIEVIGNIYENPDLLTNKGER